MTVQSQREEDGRWLPAEPMPEAFGIVWERFWKIRRSRDETWLLSLVRSFIDARAVSEPGKDT